MRQGHNCAEQAEAGAAEVAEARRPGPGASQTDLRALLSPGEYADGAEGGIQAAVELPPAEMGRLEEISGVLQHVPPMQRERVAQQLMAPGYLRALLDLFKVSGGGGSISTRICHRSGLLAGACVLHTSSAGRCSPGACNLCAAPHLALHCSPTAPPPTAASGGPGGRP